MKADKNSQCGYGNNQSDSPSKTKRRKNPPNFSIILVNWAGNTSFSTKFHKKAMCNRNGKTNEIKSQKLQQQSLYGLLD